MQVLRNDCHLRYLIIEITLYIIYRNTSRSHDCDTRLRAVNKIFAWKGVDVLYMRTFNNDEKSALTNLIDKDPPMKGDPIDRGSVQDLKRCLEMSAKRTQNLEPAVPLQGLGFGYRRSGNWNSS